MQHITDALTDLQWSNFTWRGNQVLQQQRDITADLTNRRFGYCQLSGIWTLREMQNITDALTDYQWSTAHGEVSRNYGCKESSAPDLTAFTSSLPQSFAQTREVI